MSVHHHARSAAWEHPVDLSHPWAHESLFGRLSRIGLRHPTTDKLFEQDLSACHRRSNPLTAFAIPGLPGMAGQAAEEQLRRFVGEPARQGLGRLVGSDLLYGGEGDLGSVPIQHRFLRPALRYCPLCLQRGYHSMLFQHLGVARCPGHGVALQEGCPRCREPLEPTLRGVLIKPFECSKCSSLIVKTVLSREARDEQRVVDDLIGDWRRDLAIERDLGESRASCQQLRGDEFHEPLHPRQRLRRQQRICAWPQFQTTRWMHFKQVERVLPEVELPVPSYVSGISPYAKVLADEATGTLAWLVQQCGSDHADQSHTLIQSSWMRPQYVTQDEHRVLAAIPVALHMTVCHYAQAAVDPCMHLRLDQTFKPYQGVSWNGFSAQAFPMDAGAHAALLLVYEILGFFALALLRCVDRKRSSRANALMSVAEMPPAAFCSPWKVQRDGRKLHLRVRPRVDQALVLRLLERYADTPLRRGVLCSRLSSHPNGPSWTYTRWSPRIPLELLHFPAGEPCTAGRARQAWEDM